MKTLFKLLVILGLIVYLGFAFARFTRMANEEKCVGVNIVIADSTRAGFITRTEALRLINKAGLNPIGTAIDRVNTKKIEQALLQNPFIKEAQCYKTADHHIALMLQQRLPLLRVQPTGQPDYYIDENGDAMRFTEYPADLAVATGHIDTAYAKQQLRTLGLFLHDNPFWDDQIEQIIVRKDGKVDLVPRVGAQLIHLGLPDSLGVKLNNLREFYQKVMPKVGWNAYAEIDLRHTNQVVCKKIEGKKQS